MDKEVKIGKWVVIEREWPTAWHYDIKHACERRAHSKGMPVTIRNNGCAFCHTPIPKGVLLIWKIINEHV